MIIVIDKRHYRNDYGTGFSLCRRQDTRVQGNR